MIELPWMVELTTKINIEIYQKVLDNIENCGYDVSEFNNITVLFDYQYIRLVSYGDNNIRLEYCNVIVFDSAEDNDVLDIEDLIRSRLDFLTNVLYNMDFSNQNSLYCKDKDSDEFYLT